MPPNFRRSIHLAVAILAFTVALVSALARFIVWQRMEMSVDRTIRAAEIESAVDRIYALITEAAAGQHGFLLTGDAAQLKPCREAVDRLPEMFRALENLLSDRPGEVAALRHWQATAGATLDEMNQSISTFQRDGQQAAAAMVKDSRGARTMEEMRRDRLQILEKTGEDLGTANQERRRIMNSALMWTNAAGISGVGAGLVALFMFMQAQRLAASEEVQSRRAAVAEEVGKQKGAFLANMSHEIRTPMNAVLGFAELMEGEPMTEKQRSHLNSIRQAGQSLVQLINDILDISKVEAGMAELHPHPTDIRDACEFVRTVIGQTCVKKGVDLRFDVPRSIPRSLLLDEGRVRQILVNLAGNAARFTDQGFIRIGVSAVHDPADHARLTLTLQVQDTGIGIPGEKHAEIFKAFVQADSRRHVEKQGTGLGLSIVKRLTELMGGTVSVESTPGRGSTFAVVIPGVEIAAGLPLSMQDKGDTRINLNDFPPADILVVDDNPVNRELLAGIFEGTHHQVQFATNGQEALEVMEEHRPGLVLMDVRMPIMTGTEALQKMRSTPELQAVPVIAVTASSLLEEEGTVRQNFSGYLRKPFSRVELYRQIARFLPSQNTAAVTQLPEMAEDSPSAGTQARGWTEAVRRLRRMEASTWPALLKSLAITEAKSFASRLQKIADDGECAPLRDYAALIRRHAENFAADDLERQLTAFPRVISLLEERITESDSHAPHE